MGPGTDEAEMRPTKTKEAMQGKYSTISLHAAILIIPMLLLPTILLGLIYHYKVASRNDTLPGLDLPGGAVENGIIFVDYSATRLIFIASWSSSLASILAGSFLALVSFTASQSLRPNSIDVRSNPTPYQLALILTMLSASGFGALWQWLRYLWGWRTTRQHHSTALTVLASTLVMAMLLKHV